MFDDDGQAGAVGQRLDAVIDAFAAVDLATCDDATMLEDFEHMLAMEARLRAEQIRRLRAIHTQESSVNECGRATRSWLVEELRLSPAEAGRRLRLARLLVDAPATAAAFAAGEINAEHALTVAGCLTDVPVEVRAAVEAALLDLARCTDPSGVRRGVDAVRVRLGLDEDAEAAHARRDADRHVGLDTTFGGYASLAGTLTPDVTEMFRLALDAAIGTPGPEDDRTAGQRRHDALGDVASFYLAHQATSDDAGERPRVIITIPFALIRDHPLLRAHLPGDPPGTGAPTHGGDGSGGATLGDGPWTCDGSDSEATIGGDQPISVATARRLLCDADVLPAVLGTRSDVLDLGRTTRVFSTAIRRAAWLRDAGHCAYGGCRRRIRECHHLRWWSTGGTTSLDNAAWLCAFHHWLVHEGRWSMRMEPDGYTFTDPHHRHHRFHQQPRAG